jgi:predicted membrane protein
MTVEKSPALQPRTVLGLLLMAVGVVFTLGNLRLIEAREYLKYWPLFVIAFGITLALDPRRRLAGALWSLAGAWMLASNLGVVPVSFWDLWPGVLFVLIGAHVAFGGFRRSGDFPVSSARRAHVVAVMGAHELKNDSAEFEGADMLAVMGGCDFDLRHATPRDGEALIDAVAFMGGIEIRVPRDWHVVVRGIPFMGGITDETEAPGEETGKRLVVNAFAMMGGVDIKN